MSAELSAAIERLTAAIDRAVETRSRWATRDAEARRAATECIAALDDSIIEAYRYRATLVSEVRAADDAMAAEYAGRS